MNSELIQKEKDAIERLKAFEPIGDSYYLCYSGGKDSDVIRILAQLAEPFRLCRMLCWVQSRRCRNKEDAL